MHIETSPDRHPAHEEESEGSGFLDDLAPPLEGERECTACFDMEGEHRTDGRCLRCPCPRFEAPELEGAA